MSRVEQAEAYFAKAHVTYIIDGNNVMGRIIDQLVSERIPQYGKFQLVDIVTQMREILPAAASKFEEFLSGLGAELVVYYGYNYQLDGGEVQISSKREATKERKTKDFGDKTTRVFSAIKSMIKHTPKRIRTASQAYKFTKFVFGCNHISVGLFAAEVITFVMNKNKDRKDWRFVASANAGDSDIEIFSLARNFFRKVSDESSDLVSVIVSTDNDFADLLAYSEPLIRWYGLKNAFSVRVARFNQNDTSITLLPFRTVKSQGQALLKLLTSKNNDYFTADELAEMVEHPEKAAGIASAIMSHILEPNPTAHEFRRPAESIVPEIRKRMLVASSEKYMKFLMMDDLPIAEFVTGLVSEEIVPEDPDFVMATADRSPDDRLFMLRARAKEEPTKTIERPDKSFKVFNSWFFTEVADALVPEATSEVYTEAEKAEILEQFGKLPEIKLAPTKPVRKIFKETLSEIFKLE